MLHCTGLCGGLWDIPIGCTALVVIWGVVVVITVVEGQVDVAVVLLVKLPHPVQHTICFIIIVVFVIIAIITKIKGVNRSN